MAILEAGKLAFVSGELSPDMLARADIERYINGAIELENWEVLVQGGVRRRHGTRYVATVKDPTKLTLLLPFEPSTTEAYVLEIGHQYLRFYKNGVRIENPPGTPVEVTTPYTDAQLRLVRTAQSNDVLILVHPSHAPRRLSRVSDTSWVFSLIPFYPPPTFEAGQTGTQGITLSALTGSITVTAAAGFFVQADVQRQLVAGVGRAIITAYTSGTVVTAKVVDAFTTDTFAAQTWELRGSPVAQLRLDAITPVGREVVVSLGGEQPSNSELIAHGAFDAGLTGWTDHSHPALVASSHLGGNNSQFVLHDTGTDFFAIGVQPTQIITNVTDGSTGVVGVVGDGVIIVADPGLVGGTENDFDTNDDYVITATGWTRVEGGVCTLNGGTAGYAWIEQALTTVASTLYELRFRISTASLAMLVGSASKGSDILTEASYGPGTYAVQFTATGTSTYIGFRNNQNYSAGITQVSVKVFSMPGFRSTDVGRYISVHDGLVLLRAYTDSAHMTGELLREPSIDVPAAAGAWTLEAPAWSDTLGWPSAVVLYEGRLAFAGSTRFPQTLWLSAIDDFFNFALGTNADDAVELSLVDSGGNITLNRIRWLMPAENMLVGTTHGEYRLIGSGDDPLSPVTPPRNRIQSTYGSDTVQPLKVGAALLFAQRQGSKLREMSYDERTQTTFIARDLTVTSSHLLRSARIVQLVYQPEPVSIVWAVRSDGVLLGLTYDLSEQVSAWFRVVTAGVVESVCTIPHPTANAHQVWLTVRRTVGATPTRYVERLDPDAAMTFVTPVTQENGLTHTTETQTGWAGLTLDAAMVYSGINTATLTGLTHLNGATVQAVGDGAVFAPQVVTGGQIVLPHAVHTAFVGLPYRARGKTVPVHLPTRGTTSQLSRGRWVSVLVRVQETGGVRVHGEPLPIRRPSMPMDQGPALASGDVRCVPLGWSGHGVITFEADDPLPATILGIYGLRDQEGGER